MAEADDACSVNPLGKRPRSHPLLTSLPPYPLRTKVDQINKELLRQRNYGLEWGALVPGFPKTFDERLARRQGELEALRAKAVACGTAGVAFSTTYGAEYAQKDGAKLERGLNKAFRTLKAGV